MSQLLHSTNGLRLSALQSLGFIRKIFFRIAFSHAYNITLDSSLRTYHRHLVSFHASEPFLQNLSLLHLTGNPYFLWNKCSLAVILLQKCTQNLRVRFIPGIGKEKMLPANHFSASDKKYLNADPGLGSCHTNGILIPGAHNNALALSGLFYSLQLVPKSGSQFKVQLLCSSQHPLFNLCLHSLGSALHKKAYLVNHCIILLLWNNTCAGSQTPLDMILKTWSVGIHTPAGAQRKKFSQELQALVKCSNICKGSKIFCPVTNYPSGNVHPWILLLQSHLQVGIGLVILKTDIVFWTVLLYKIALQNQCFYF